VNDEDSIQAVEKAIGEPLFLGFSDAATKMRTHLLLASSIALAVWFADLRIRDGSTFLGLQFNGVGDDLLRRGLACVVVYLLLHFGWNAVDAFLEWRLRITGTRLAFVTTGKFAATHADYPNDPRQSTLHTWWTRESPKIGKIAEHVQRFEDALAPIEEQVKSHPDNVVSGLDASSMVRMLAETRNAMEGLRAQLKNTADVFSSPRPAVSLERFDRWTLLFNRSQNWRWLLIEFTLPLALGILSACLLVSSLPNLRAPVVAVPSPASTPPASAASRGRDMAVPASNPAPSGTRSPPAPAAPRQLKSPAPP